MEHTIPLMVETSGQAQEINIQESQMPDMVKQELKKDKWVTLENNDGSTETLTKSDLPPEEDSDNGELSEEDKKLQDKWKGSFNTTQESSSPTTTAVRATPTKFIKKFEELKSVTSTSKDKGG